MTFLNESPLGLTKEEYILYRDLVARKCGLYFDGSRKDLLEAGLMVRIKETEARGFMDYYTRLDEDTSSKEEFFKLLDLLTVKETFFMRDSAQFDALSKEVIPEIMRRREKEDRSISIWSAACSTGEEPYSIVMTLLNILPDPMQWNIRILATDISGMALKSARRGIYNGRSLRGLGDEDRSRFFEKKGNDYHIMPHVKTMVEFSQLNLIQDAFPFPDKGGWDIVFCRNVVIYFQMETVRHVFQKINSNLDRDGFLFTGYSEILRYVTDDFSSVNLCNSFIYKKNGRTKDKREGETLSRNNGQITTPINRVKKAQKSHSLELEKSRLPLSPSTVKRINDLKEVQKKVTVPVEVKENKGPVEYVDLAVRLANQGKHDEAIGHCRRSIAEAPLFTDAYLMAGLIFKGKGDLENAAGKFKKVLFLDPDYFLARMYLADIYLQQENGHKKTKIEYNNIIRGLEQNPQKELGRFAGGFTADTLIQVCQVKLSRMEKLK